ncbi:TadE/TadG family type IV pilus assembly protein [Devosia sp. RR2S18]|uniref:TadE/TadG family type IV pilus assembly protein n=1 Tax=Devosia rhizosphaerae TaxID=3049774 RepID=UPI002541B7AD|nr:TadE/TadG family type IV pilus assembly protein [Devosia sp. RR2S18]WIJ24884.1 pilus assembly protein [Devosia sp. RR2S18]
MTGRLASRIGRKLLGKRRRFARDERGATAVEFGLLAFPFFAIVGAILEQSLVFLSGQVLTSAVQDASRLIRTGQATATNFDIDKFRDIMCGRLYGLFDCSEVHLMVTAYTNFSEVEFVAPVDWDCEIECGWTEDQEFAPGTANSVVIVQAHYKRPVIVSFGGAGQGNLGDGRRLLGAAAVFMNEPF